MTVGFLDATLGRLAAWMIGPEPVGQTIPEPGIFTYRITVVTLIAAGAGLIGPLSAIAAGAGLIGPLSAPGWSADGGLGAAGWSPTDPCKTHRARLSYTARAIL